MDVATYQLLVRWPGKSPIQEGGPAHAAAYHILDVAAAAEQLIGPWRLPPALGDTLVLLIALHDIGKVGNEFRARLQTGTPQTWRHWEVSEALLIDNEDWLANCLGCSRHAFRPLVAAVAGHHGRPPSASGDH